MSVFPPRMPLLSAEDLEAAGTAGQAYELWDGQLQVMEPAGIYASATNLKLAAKVLLHVEANDLGWVSDSSGGFIVRRRPDRVLAPDVGFVPRSLLTRLPPAGFAEVVPTFVAEVRSPGQSWEMTLARGGIWLGHEVAVVWLVDPLERRAVELRQDGSAVLRGPDDTLDGAPALPGLLVRLADLLPPRG